MFLICLVIFYLLIKLPRIFTVLLNSLFPKFQDLCLRKKIGNARKVNSLYSFKEDISLRGEAQSVNSELSFSNEDEIILWHL